MEILYNEMKSLNVGKKKKKMKPKGKSRYSLSLADCHKSAADKGGTCLSLE